jgi:pimeloyl-ACP methyl ester carboxylesterase
MRGTTPEAAGSGGAGRGRGAFVVFASACAVLALHIVVDAFIVTRPGTGATDHLVPGLVPLALLAAAVFVFPRLGAGRQAAVSLVLGAVTLAGAAVTAQGLLGGLRGNAVTGVLLAPAGLVLIGLGVWLLWAARRRGRGRVLRGVLLVLAVILGAYIVVLPIAMAIVATQRPAREAPDVAAVDLGRPARAVSVRTADGLTLRGWYVPSTSGAAVLTFPREWTEDQARVLAEHGYGVLLLDPRGYGDSEGDPNAYGWGPVADVRAGLDFLEEQSDLREGRIGGLGLSVGGEQLIEAAASDPRLEAVVSEGAGERSVREAAVRGVRGWPALPSMAVQTAAVAVLSGHAPPPSLRDLVARIAPRPLFLINAENGGGGEELTPEYYAAAGPPKQLWTVPDAGHTGGLAAQPDEYRRRVLAFFDEALLGQHRWRTN